MSRNFFSGAAEGPSTSSPHFLIILGLSVTTTAFLVSTIFLAVKDDGGSSVAGVVGETPAAEEIISNVPHNKFFDLMTMFDKGDNTCKNKNPKFENVDCIHVPGPQAGSNVTKGFVGGMEVDVVPNTNNYWQSSMCPVNVHWHLGTEHYSVGEYDEDGVGPNGNAPKPEYRRLAEGSVRGGFRCHHYDKYDSRFTTEYDWKHCIGMKVGETYEVHWPHSAAGACGTVNQYQTPFYDGVFCNLDSDTIATLGPQDVASAVGVQGQIYTVVNDEEYFYPDMIRGWIVDGDYGKDIHYYTGSTTGTSRNNEVCSSYTPITWQVDRKCHLISASSFDKLCYDMKLQRDDMSDDLHAHGSRELVKPSLVGNNQQRRNLAGHDHDDHDHDYYHDGNGVAYYFGDHAHSHDGHDHDHDHHQWF